MDKFIAVVCDDETMASQAIDALLALHEKAEIVVYAHAIVHKSPAGVVSLQRVEDEGPIGAAFGMLMGALVGVLAGPAAVASGAAVAGSAAAASAAAGGMAVGSTAGGLMGFYRDLFVSGIDAEVLDIVSTELRPGKSCVVASLDETWTTPLEVAVKELGATIYRQPRIDVVDDKLAAEAERLNRELGELHAELRQFGTDVKEAVNAKISKAKENIQDTLDRIDARLDQLDAEFEARISALDLQIESAIGEASAKFRARKAELEADFGARKAKLQAARKLAAEALS